MSDIYNELTGRKHIPQQACRVAYTLNNEQPVICTIIGQQPLFYMDYDYQYEDEDDFLLDAAEFNILENEIDNLQRELDRFESFSEAPAQSTEEKVANFLDDAAFITTDHTNKKDAVDIEDLKTLLKESRLAKAYLECTQEYGVELAYSAQIETAQYERKASKILINPSLNEADRILLCVQELRRHWQHRHGALINPLTFHPDNAILVNRAQVADLAVSIIRTAWELQLSGYRAAWERLENSSLGDLARAFAREAFLDFRTINNGQAAAAVFEAWFLSERCRAEDKKIINHMLADHSGYVFDKIQSSSALTPSLIAALGEMPFGKNYLAEHAATIMDDAIFTDVRDRSNANFLWFIKFERTFRETEQELQNCAGQDKEDTPSSEVQPKTQGLTDEQKSNASSASNSATVIQLAFGSDSDAAQKNTVEGKEQKSSGRRLASKSKRVRGDDKGDLSNIVYLRSKPAE